MDTAELEKEVLCECALDHVGLWELVWMAAGELGTEDESDPEVRAVALTVALNLLKAGLIRAGLPKGRLDFEPWALSPDEAVARIEREWDVLGREPILGEVAWFDITEKGRALLDGE